MNMDLGTYIVFFVVGWLVAWAVTRIYSLSTLDGLLNYLRNNKETRFLEVIGGGSYVPFWKRPPWGFYDVVPYVFSTEDNDDEIVCKHKSIFKKAIILHLIVTISFYGLSILASFASKH